MATLSIKTIKISGFRSFRQQDCIEPFSNGHNALVGRNGAGKSNFFDAVQFCLLAPRFYNLRQEERQRLLHEGSGATATSAYVEITFDNSSGRVPIEGDDVTLRRAIGAKKDEFFVQRRRVTKREVEGLLENAGFSRANPYYIVQQGKVSALCVARDEDRLALLKEVGGAGVYETKRAEAAKTLDETSAKRESIKGVLQAIDSRLQELEGEKEELQRYERLDREHRALQYALHDGELQRARSALEALDSERDQHADRADDAHADLAEADRIVDSAQKAQDRALADAESKEQDASRARDQLSISLARKAEAQARRDGLQARVERDATWKDRAVRALQASTEACTESRNEMASKETQRRKLKDRDLEAIHALQRAEARHRELERGETFASKRERDNALGPRLEELREAQSRADATAARAQDVLREASSRLSKLKDDVSTTHKKATQSQRAAEKSAQQRDAKAEDVPSLERTAAEAKREVMRCRAKEQEGERDVKDASLELTALAPRAVQRGLRALDELLEGDLKHLKTKVRGPLVEHIRLAAPKYLEAVEAAAGPRLWQVIVDDDATAAELVRALEQDPSRGRLTFMPLNRLKVPQPVRVPDDALGDVVSLRQSAFDTSRSSTVDPALDLVFGRHLLARDLDCAARRSKQLDADAVTLEGDEAFRKGAIRGGGRDRASALRACLLRKRASSQLQQASQEREQAQRKADQASKAASNAIKGRDDAEKARAHHVAAAQALIRDHDSLHARCVELESKVARDLPDRSANASAAARALKEDADAVESRLKAPFKASRTLDADRRELDELKVGGSRRVALENARNDASSALQAVDESLRSLRATFENKLRKRRDALRSALGLVALVGDQDRAEGDPIVEDAMDTDEDFADVEPVSAHEASERRAELAKAASALSACVSAYDADASLVKDAEKDASEARSKAHGDAFQRLETALQRQSVARNALAEVTKSGDALHAKRARLVDRSEAAVRKLQQVGALPQREVATFRDLPEERLVELLATCHQDRAKFSKVNKKALDQFVAFADQRSGLLDRARELDEGAKAILSLLSNLDAKKDEAIERTFRGVSKHFSEVFSELAPGGSAEMVMVRRSVPEVSSQSSASTGAGGAFRGVRIQVRFPGGNDDVTEMNQLSGGQKALVALAQIFAIQRCDPAPFYLFDEIDAALDATHRTAVASLIKKQAHAADNQAQFITTTFRPEFVSVADAHFGISLQHKTSRLHRISKDDATAFVTENAASSEP
jgi:structural maintenance of chromosome 3 (chondroitin sulfate proteoglycan 6)